LRNKTFFFITILSIFTAQNLSTASNKSTYLNTYQSNAYRLFWQMEFDLAKIELSKSKHSAPNDPYNFLVQSFGSVIELVAVGDRYKFQQNKILEHKWLDSLSTLKDSPQKEYVIAAVKLHWALAKAVFGDGFSAAWNIRQSYIMLGEINKNNPKLLPASIYYGVLNIALSNISESYHWAAQLTGLIGYENKGLQILESMSQSSDNDIALEASIFLLVIKSHLEFPRKEILDDANFIISKYKHYDLVSLLVAWIYNKNNYSKEAKILLSSMSSSHTSALITHTMGVANLQTMEYKLAKNEFLKFLKESKGNSLKKDTYYKLSQIAILEVDSVTANKNKSMIKKVGDDHLFADKYAQTMTNYPLCNRTSLIGKLYLDGGLFEKSISQYLLFRPNTQAEKAEKNYHLGVNYEKMNDIQNAMKFYGECARYCPKNFFYGPLACVKLMKISMDYKDKTNALLHEAKLQTFKNYAFKKQITEKSKKIISNK
jgi:hypothetical protein